MGLVVAPTIVGLIKDSTTTENGQEHDKYHFVFAFFILINVVGLALNLSLYFIDVT